MCVCLLGRCAQIPMCKVHPCGMAHRDLGGHAPYTASGTHTDVLSTRRYIRGTCKHMRDACRDVFRPMHRPAQCHPHPVCSCHYPQCPAAYTLVRFNQQMSTEYLVYGQGGRSVLCSWDPVGTLKKQTGLTIYKSQDMEAT